MAQVLDEGKCRAVLERVLEERRRQVAIYGLDDELEDGTGPEANWLRHTAINLDLMDATEIEDAFRREYVRYEHQNGLPTWMHLVREELAEAFKENKPRPLTTELLQLAALCVSWVETIERRGR